MPEEKNAQTSRKKLPARVLVTDSDEETRCLFERLLNNCGYCVKTFRNPKDCIAEISRDRPDLLLINQSHLLACRKELRNSISEASDVPIAVIVVTSNNAVIDEIDWPASCSVRAVRDPLHTDQLLNAMCELPETG